MSKYKPNHVFGVPKLWKALMNDKKDTRHGLIIYEIHRFRWRKYEGWP